MCPEDKEINGRGGNHKRHNTGQEPFSEPTQYLKIQKEINK